MELPAESFLRHRGLILAAAGGAVLEGGLLALLAPGALSVAPQGTAIPALAAYHDLRWLFADNQSWLWFAGLVAVVLTARAAFGTLLLRLAWPRGVPAPPAGRAFASCLALTAVAWLLLSPAVTLAFGAAVVPFSWPFIAALPIMLGMVAALSHGGVLTAWWRRLPPARAVLWLLGSFASATAAGLLITRLPLGGALAVVAAAGLVNARAWYGLACLAARVQPRAHVSVPARVVFGLPFAPLSALLVFATVVYVARLLFTGTLQIPISPSGGPAEAARAGTAVSADRGAGGPAPGGTAAVSPAAAVSGAGAVLVVEGWGSSCCGAGSGLRSELPGMTVRQFSYVGLWSDGKPRPSSAADDDVSLPVLGQRIADQVRALHQASGKPVAVVAESEGTLGVYAALALDPSLPVSAVVLLSPIVGPGQVSYSSGAGDGSVSGVALSELNHLVGNISPYGPGGAENLINSVGEVGARFFDAAVGDAGPASGNPVRWLTVVPLADALTLPDCSLPPGVIVVPALHGGLLGDPAVMPMVASFLSGQPVSDSDHGLRDAAEAITGASSAWRMPDTGAGC